MFVDTFNELLDDRNLNRKQFAELCGIPYTTVVGWTKLGRLPDFVSIIKIADFFNCSTDFLMGRGSQFTTEGFGVTQEENLLKNFEKLSKDDKQFLIKLIEKMTK